MDSKPGGRRRPERLYDVFGLRVASAIELPEFTAADSDDSRTVDVVIGMGAVAGSLAGGISLAPSMHVSPTEFLLDVAAGRYRVTAGCKITIDPAPNAEERDIRLYLLGTVMGALCHQRDLLPLHASAVAFGDGAFALAGPSGVGKSTLAAHLQARGREVLCDDLCVVEFTAGGAPRLWPGIARIKLWRDAVAAAGGQDAALEPVATGVDKLSLPIIADSKRRPRALQRIYVLSASSASRTTITRISGARAASAVVANVYRWPLAAAMGQAPAQFSRCATLARRCEVFVAQTPWNLARLSQAIDVLERHLERTLPERVLPLAVKGL